jgi:succinate-semialdehyde dehydrogenase / glutarate-semialdehyde dehydrogenase
MNFQSINPASGIVIEEFRQYDPAEVDDILSRAATAGEAWRSTSIEERADRMRAAAALLTSQAPRLGRVMTDEMGKPIAQAIAEAEKCAWVCHYYADNAHLFLSEEPVCTDGSESFVRYDPLGTILAVMPWNFPFWQVFRFAAPALMAGNTAVLKHASNVSRCALEIEALFRAAGFPPDVFRTVLIGSSRVAELIADPRIAAVTLTGSEPAGAAVASCAGAHLKKTVLELGGSDPFIVLEHADVAAAASVAATARCINNGQSCIAAKRFIVVDHVAEAFERAFVAAMAAKKVGDPLDPATDIGPIARDDLLNELLRQIARCTERGARLLLGGNRIAREGWYLEPTVLGNVQSGMPAYTDELFGPVASVIRARDTDDALRIANDTPFGLGASIWTEDIETAKRLAARVDAGCVFINGMVKSDPRLPFGGVKRSGYGRELSGVGIREFVNIKSVWVR